MIWAGIFCLGFWLSIAKLCGARFLDDVSWWLTTAPIWGPVLIAVGWIWCLSRILTLNPFLVTEYDDDGIIW